MKTPKRLFDVNVLIEQIGDDGELLVEAIKSLTKVAGMTCDVKEREEICAALNQLCGKSSDPDPNLSEEHI